MCQQIYHHYACSHLTPGPIIRCAILLGVQHLEFVTRLIIRTDRMCPLCGPYQVSLPPPPPYTPPPQFNIPVVGQGPPYYPTFAPPYQVPAIHMPSPLPAYQAPPQAASGYPLPVPLNTPTSTRYEYIGGRIQPITHYHLSSHPTSTPQHQRGFNVYHGYDTGSLPPGYATVAPPSLNWNQREAIVMAPPSKDSRHESGSCLNANGQVNVESSQRDVVVGENVANGSSGENLVGQADEASSVEIANAVVEGGRENQSEDVTPAQLVAANRSGIARVRGEATAQIGNRRRKAVGAGSVAPEMESDPAAES